MSIEIDYKSFENIDNLLRYQNHLLVRQIAKDKNWPLEELKKFIPEKVTLKTPGKPKVKKSVSKKSVSRAEPNFKIIQKKVVRKKVAKPKEDTKAKKKVVKGGKSKVEKLPSDKPKKRIRKVVKKTESKKDESSVVELDESKKDTIPVQLIEFCGDQYYLSPDTDKVYISNEVDELEFVGMREGNQINLDAESAEDN